MLTRDGERRRPSWWGKVATDKRHTEVTYTTLNTGKGVHAC